MLWDHRRICGPSLTETSVCGACPYCRESGIRVPKDKLRMMLTTVRRKKELPAELSLLSYFIYFRSILIIIIIIYPFQVRLQTLSLPFNGYWCSIPGVKQLGARSSPHTSI